MSYELNRHLAARRPPLPTSSDVDTISSGIIRGAFETIWLESTDFKAHRRANRWTLSMTLGAR